MHPVPELDLKSEQRKIYRGIAAAFLVCIVFLPGVHVLLPDFIDFPGDDLRSQLTFWACAALFVVAWVMIGIGMVSHGRRHSAQDIRGSAYAPPSPRIAVRVAFLENTLEQAVVAVLVHFALILLFGTQAMAFVAGSVVLFGLGRVAFLVGYPKGAGARSFGMVVTVLPTLAAFVLALGAVIRSVWR